MQFTFPKTTSTLNSCIHPLTVWWFRINCGRLDICGFACGTMSHAKLFLVWCVPVNSYGHVRTVSTPKKGGEWRLKSFHDQSPGKNRTGPGSTSRPMDLQTDTLAPPSGSWDILFLPVCLTVRFMKFLLLFCSLNLVIFGLKALDILWTILPGPFLILEVLLTRSEDVLDIWLQSSN